MKFKPLKDRVLIKYSDEADKSVGGIYIPDTAKEKPQEGKVIAVGAGKVTDNGKVQKMEVKVSDIVLFDKYSGAKIEIDEEEYLIVREEDILGVVEK